MSYSKAEVEPLAKRLCHDLPGFHIEVARVWIESESGVFNNPLGVTSGGKLVHYSSQIAGIDAAAGRLKTLTYYRGVIASTHGGSIREQALALIASPWNVRNSPYYRRIFGAAGLLTVPGPVQERIAELKKLIAINEATLAKYEAELAALQ